MVYGLKNPDHRSRLLLSYPSGWQDARLSALRLPVVKISHYNRPLRVVSLSNEPFGIFEMAFSHLSRKILTLKLQMYPNIRRSRRAELYRAQTNIQELVPFTSFTPHYAMLYLAAILSTKASGDGGSFSEGGCALRSALCEFVPHFHNSRCDPDDSLTKSGIIFPKAWGFPPSMPYVFQKVSYNYLIFN